MKLIPCAALVLLVQTAFAHGPGSAVRYRIEEVPAPASLMQGCIAGYRNMALGVSVNDFGMVAGNLVCTSQVDVPAAFASEKVGAFRWSSWLDSIELPDDGLTIGPSAVSINNRGDIFGAAAPTDSFHGVRWPLGGGQETLFSDVSCRTQGLDFNVAIAGNGRYTVGLGLRLAPELGAPYDTYCFQMSWLIKTPAGAEVLGPRGYPRAMNALNIAVGLVESAGSAASTAIRYNVATRQQRVLRVGDADNRPITTDINDAGEVAGYIEVHDDPANPLDCWSGIALRWDRNDRETRLPLLPGDVANRAWAVGDDGETYGESGPGEYCAPQYSSNETAVVWRNGRVFDLNDSIPPSARIKLVTAYAVNRHGQVVVHGYRRDEPRVICPRFVVDPETDAASYDLTGLCPRMRTYLLTQAGR